MSLEYQLEHALSEGMELRRLHKVNALMKMGIDPDSETGRYVLQEFDPQWSHDSGIKYVEVCDPDTIFEFLTESAR